MSDWKDVAGKRVLVKLRDVDEACTQHFIEASDHGVWVRGQEISNDLSCWNTETPLFRWTDDSPIFVPYSSIEWMAIEEKAAVKSRTE